MSCWLIDTSATESATCWLADQTPALDGDLNRNNALVTAYEKAMQRGRPTSSSNGEKTIADKELIERAKAYCRICAESGVISLQPIKPEIYKIPKRPIIYDFPDKYYDLSIGFGNMDMLLMCDMDTMAVFGAIIPLGAPAQSKPTLTASIFLDRSDTEKLLIYQTDLKSR